MKCCWKKSKQKLFFINGVGAKSFDKRDYDRVKEAYEHAGKLTAFRDKTALLRKEWSAMNKLEVDEEDQAEHAERQNLGRLQRGIRTREEVYYKPILQTLEEMGGSGKVADVLDMVGKKMKGILKDVDYEPLASYPDNPRWRNAAQWARQAMIYDGLLKSDSPRGIWEISEKGRKFLAGETN